VLTFVHRGSVRLDRAFAKVKALGWPAPLYVTIYYSQHGDSVFNLAVSQLLWKSTAKVLIWPRCTMGCRG